MKMNKKGVIENLQALIGPLIGIALVLVIGFLIMATIKDKVVELGGNNITTINETVAGWSNDTYSSLTFGGNCMTVSCSGLTNNNGTHGNFSSTTVVYSCHPSRGITISDVNSLMNDTVKVTYICDQTTRAWNATGQIQEATSDIPGWIPIIIITIIGALLLFLVTKFRER